MSAFRVRILPLKNVGKKEENQRKKIPNLYSLPSVFMMKSAKKKSYGGDRYLKKSCEQNFTFI